MKRIADILEVHETTVSRAVAGKYMQTPRGLLAMKYFFKPGVRTISGELVSNEHAKAILAELISKEDKKETVFGCHISDVVERAEYFHFTSDGCKVSRPTKDSLFSSEKGAIN